MPPKSSKKRKAGSLGTQSTLDAFRRGSPTTKVSRDSPPDSHTATRINQTAAEISEQSSDDVYKPIVTTIQSKDPFVADMRTQDSPILMFTDIKGFEVPEQAKDAFFEDNWRKLQKLLHTIFHKQERHMSLQLGYEACSTVCELQKAEELYQRLTDEFSAYIKDNAVKLRHMVSADLRQFVRSLNRVWIQLSEELVLLRSVFIELDRQYLIRKTSHSSLIDFGQGLFRSIIMESDLLRNSTISEILKLIEDERNGEAVNQDELRNLIGMLSKLDMYVEYFEPSLLEDARAYYESEANQNIRKMAISEYLTYADKRLHQESIDRIENYLEKSSRLPLIQVVNAQFVHAHLDFILAHGFDDLMDRTDRESLRILYEFLLENDGLGQLRIAFADYIKKRGKELIQDPKRDQTMVESLLAYKAKLDDIISYCFGHNEHFLHAEKESFESFINSRRSRPAELLAKYIDSKLRATTKKNDEDFEAIIGRLLSIFRYLQDRDTFEAFYKRHLSKRLLLGRSVSSDVEKMMLSKLKDECGAGFTKNLEAMFKDVEVSADLQSQFTASEQYPRNSDISFRVTVLAQGIWPTYSLSEVILPSKMMECQTAYERFYASKNKGRRLTWQNFLASCIVKAHFPSGTKDIQISLLQTVVLLLFNKKDTYSYTEIAAGTNMDQKELKRVLASLACGQYQLLLKQRDSDNGNDDEDQQIASGDIFTYNSNFTSSNVRIKINVAQQDQVGDERKATERKVLVDRQHQLEAAIVRIMKSKKKLVHSDLMKELFLQIKFPLEASDIKKRIESLIDRDYLGRDEDDGNMYTYK